MVMVTLDIPQEINKKVEHFKIEHELKDKRDAIVMLLKQCTTEKKDLVEMENAVCNDRLRKLFRMADKTKMHNLTPEELKEMDKDVYG